MAAELDQPPRRADIPAAVRDTAVRGEPDRYLAATLAPFPARAACAAIAAFAAELGRIPATVSEPLLGDIRLQWWRDALAAMRPGHASGHPVADALAEALQGHALPSALLGAMIDARELDLSGGLPESDAGLAAYLDRTEGHAFRLALAAVGAPEALREPLSRPAGLAYGLARSLGRLPMLLHNGGLPLPAERLRAAGLEPSRLLELRATPEAAAAVAQVAAGLAAMAREALADVRRQIAGLPRPLRAPLLPLAMVEPYLRAQSGRPRLDHMADVTPLARAFRIGLAHLTGRP